MLRVTGIRHKILDFCKTEVAHTLGVAGQAPIRDNSIPSWCGAAGVNVHSCVQWLLVQRTCKVRDLQTVPMNDSPLRGNCASTSKRALGLAQARYTLGLRFIVEFTQAELQKTEADIADIGARCQYCLSRILVAL